jgi:hypothetical protein
MKYNFKKLPKKFKEKWIAALRSGEYKQGDGMLYDSASNSYCCLGVAGVILGIPESSMEARASIYEELSRRTPKALLTIDNRVGENLTQDYLMANNDGTFCHAMNRAYKRKTFKQIANLIEKYL